MSSYFLLTSCILNQMLVGHPRMIVLISFDTPIVFVQLPFMFNNSNKTYRS